MGDVKLTPRQTADLLAKLDQSLRSINAVRDHVIGAMAERSAEPPPRPKIRSIRKGRASGARS